MSAIGVVVQLLRAANGTRLTSEQMYAAGVFESKEALAQALSHWSAKNTFLLRERSVSARRFQYWLSDTPVPANIDTDEELIATHNRSPAHKVIVAAKAANPLQTLGSMRAARTKPAPKAVEKTPEPARVVPITPAPKTLAQMVSDAQKRLQPGQQICIRPDHVGVLAMGNHYKVDIAEEGALENVLAATAMLIGRRV